jgi:hypothetical protein
MEMLSQNSEAGWQQASLTDVKGGILPPGKRARPSVASGIISNRRIGRELLSSGWKPGLASGMEA